MDRTCTAPNCEPCASVHPPAPKPPPTPTYWETNTPTTYYEDDTPTRHGHPYTD